MCMLYARTLRAKFASVKRELIRNRKIDAGSKVNIRSERPLADCLDYARSLREELHDRFTLCMSIYDYFTNMHAEYTSDPPLVLR
jgi:hypothetical protein